MKFAGAYGVFVGLMMLAQWGFFLATGSVPELQTAPLAISFHIAAEVLCAAVLISSGWGLLARRAWAGRLYPVAAGMVIYSGINSPGYFAQSGQWPFVAMFGVVVALALASVVAYYEASRQAVPPSERTAPARRTRR